MSTETYHHVPDDQVEEVVAAYKKIGWSCDVRKDGAETSTIVATSPPNWTGQVPAGATGHMAAAKDLAERASAHAALASVNLGRADG